MADPVGSPATGPASSVVPGSRSASPAAEVPEDAAESPDDVPFSSGDVLARLEAALDEVRPGIRRDGGDVDLLGFHAGVVTVRLRGACRSCFMAEMTLQLGIERVLKERVPEVVRVEAG